MQDHLTKRSFHYFDHPLKHKFWSLLKHRLLFFLATGLMGIFLPIYLLTEGNLNIIEIVILYGSASFAYVLLIPHMKHVINSLHIQASLIWAVIFFALYLATLAYGVPYDVSLVVLAFIFLTGFRFLYFTPYISEFSAQTEGGQTSRQVGMVMIAKSITSVIAPFIAGMIITYFSYNVLYGIAVFFMLLSIAPLTSLGQEKHIHFSWSPKKVVRTYRQYFRTKAAIAYIGLGAETFIILFIWPLVLYMILDGNILLVGIIATAISLIMIILQAIGAKLFDTKLSRRKSAYVLTPLSSFGWIAKIFITSTGGVLLVGVYHDITRAFLGGSISSLEADALRETKDYMDEFVAVREMYIHTGRFLAAIIIVILLTSFTIQTVLWIAVVASLLQIGFLRQGLSFSQTEDTIKKESIPEDAVITFRENPEVRFGPGEEVR